MPCFHPLKGYRSKELTSNGKRTIVFNIRQALDDQTMTIACGQCIGCRLERSRQWATRCYHESTQHTQNCFITLTFSDEHKPTDGSLQVKHMQDFMKRLRRWENYNAEQENRPERKIRFFACGEYGERNLRPHYHACLFGFDFMDKELWSETRGNKTYRSGILEKLWPFGFALIGDVTFESAAYVARYITKKITGEKASLHYTDLDYDTGEILGERVPEFTTMSRRPGIGKTWYEKYSSDCYPSDFIIINGKKCKPPRYYDKIHAVEQPIEHDEIIERRTENAKLNHENKSYERLRVLETIAKLRLKKLKRGYEAAGD